MSISTDITGNVVNSTNQLFDLLALVSNPTQYEAKLKALQDATEEYKKHVALVGPASEILQIREGMDAARKDLDELIAAKQKEAEDELSSAKEQAQGILASSKEEFERNKQAAQLLIKEANSTLSGARTTKKQAEELLKVTEARAKQLDEDKKAVEELRATAEATIAEYQALKDELAAKHKAFIEGL